MPHENPPPSYSREDEEWHQSSKFVAPGHLPESGVGGCPRGRSLIDGCDPVSLEAIRTVRQMMDSPEMYTWSYHLRIVHNALCWLRSHGYYLASHGPRSSLDELGLCPAEERGALDIEMVARSVDREVARMDSDCNTNYLGEYLG